MKLDDFSFEVYCAILDLYAAICGGASQVSTIRNKEKYDALINEFKSRSAVERRLGSHLSSFSKLWFTVHTNGTISVSFDARLTDTERLFLADKEECMTTHFNDHAKELLDLYEEKYFLSSLNQVMATALLQEIEALCLQEKHERCGFIVVIH